MSPPHFPIRPRELRGRWTYAAADYAVALAGRAGARRVALFPHRPDWTDDALDELARRFAAVPVPVLVAAEEQILDV